MDSEGKPNGRQGRYIANMGEQSRESNAVPKNSSRLEMSIINIAHGEEPSNYEHKSVVDEENGDPQDPENEDINVKFKKVKDHGLMAPLHPQQIGTWVVMTILVLSFYLFLVPGTYYISTGFVVFIILTYTGLFIGVVIFCLRATLTDPTDRNVLYERQWRKDGIEAEENDELEFFCDVCEAYVHERTKHWGEWNRCSDLFDHHCKWLNNCIGGKNYADFLILISVLLGQTVFYMIISFIFVITALADKGKFQEGFQEFYGADLNRFGLAFFIVLLNVLCALIVFFTASLILLHIKLKKIGLTAYEYIVFKDEREERLELYNAGEMSEGEFQEEERKAQEDLRMKKKSKIIHQINKENKKAYRDRIIERNNKAKAKQEREAKEREIANANQTPGRKTNKPKITKHQSEKKKEDFDDIMKGDKNPERVQSYSAGPKMNPSARKEKYADIEDIKIDLEPQDPKKKLNFATIKENSEESKDSKEGKSSPEDNKNKNTHLSSEKVSSSSAIDDLNDRDGDTERNQESDLNDRADWKLSDDKKASEKATSDTNLQKVSKEEDISSQRKLQRDITKMEKQPPSELDEISDST